MTLKERRNPTLVKNDVNRRIRITKGSGKKQDDINKMISEWDKAKKKFEEMGKLLKSGRNPFGNFM